MTQPVDVPFNHLRSHPTALRLESSNTHDAMKLKRTSHKQFIRASSVNSPSRPPHPNPVDKSSPNYGSGRWRNQRGTKRSTLGRRAQTQRHTEGSDRSSEQTAPELTDSKVSSCSTQTSNKNRECARARIGNRCECVLRTALDQLWRTRCAGQLNKMFKRPMLTKEMYRNAEEIKKQINVKNSCFALSLIYIGAQWKEMRGRSEVEGAECLNFLTKHNIPYGVLGVTQGERGRKLSVDYPKGVDHKKPHIILWPELKHAFPVAAMKQHELEIGDLCKDLVPVGSTAPVAPEVTVEGGITEPSKQAVEPRQPKVPSWMPTPEQVMSNLTQQRAPIVSEFFYLNDRVYYGATRPPPRTKKWYFDSSSRIEDIVWAKAEKIDCRRVFPLRPMTDVTTIELGYKTRHRPDSDLEMVQLRYKYYKLGVPYHPDKVGEMVECPKAFQVGGLSGTVKYLGVDGEFDVFQGSIEHETIAETLFPFWNPALPKDVKVLSDEVVGEPTKFSSCTAVQKKAAVMTEAALVRSLMPSHLVGPFNTHITKHLMNDFEDFHATPLELAQNLMRMANERSSVAGVKFGTFELGNRVVGDRSCYSCGLKRPKKFRWKHGLCTECEKGNITDLALQYSEGQCTASGHPGLVRVQTNALPLPAKLKTWATRENLQTEACNIDRNDDQTDQLPRKGFTLVGFGVAGAVPLVTTPGVQSSRDALKARVFQVNEQRAEDSVWEIALKMKSELLDFQFQPKMEFEDWLNSMPSRRRRALKQAHEEYLSSGYVSKRHASFKAFVKTELLAVFDQDVMPIPRQSYKPRLIQGPNDVSHVVAGPVLKPLVKQLKKVWNGELLFYGSQQPELLDEWFNNNYSYGKVLLMCDYSMFDCTHSKQSWEFMESIYREFCESDDDFWRVLDDWRKPSGKMGKGAERIRYFAEIMNASGRDDTAFANAVVNGFCIALSLTAVYHHINIEDLTPIMVRSFLEENKVSVCGDDTLAILNPIKWNLDEISRNISRFGMKADSDKIQISQDPFNCVYLGCRPYPTSKGWMFGPTLGRRLYKHHCMIKDGDPYAWLTGVAQMEVNCYAHVPVLYDMAENILKLRKGKRRTPYAHEAQQYTLGPRSEPAPHYSTSSEVLQYLANGYEVTVSCIEELISTIKGNQRLPVILSDVALNAFVCKDDL